MRKVFIIYPTPEGSKEIPVESERLSFGRGSEADLRFADDGLSRLHASVYRDGDRVWIADENSTNGTFVNGARVGGTGTPLKDGDAIKIGHFTNLKISIAEKPMSAPSAQMNRPTGKSVSVATNNPTNLVPIVLIAVALFVVSISAVLIGVTALGGGQTEVVQNAGSDDLTNEDRDDENIKAPTPTPKPEKTATVRSTVSDNTNFSDNANFTDSPEAANTGKNANLPSGKKYSEMSDGERRQYLAVKAMRVAQIIGNSSSDQIPPEAIEKIKGFADGFASRAKVKPQGGCRFGDNLQITFERASRNAPFIVRAFNEKGIDPRIGLYLAMIESEHCVCLQSPTGPLGMFQFTFATAKLHFVPSEGIIKGANKDRPDERCQPEPAAKAAASYMKALTGRYGTGPASVPLAIGSYNSGEGGLSTNLVKALESGTGLPRDFWTLISRGELLSKQFQAENFKYVPKFFAAAIIGENPQDFGLNLQPVSTYTK